MLSAETKAAGRVFRAQAQADLDALCATDPPDHTVPNVLAVLRHACPARGNRSSSLELTEIYRYSPGFLVETAGDGTLTVHEHHPAADTPADIPADMFVGTQIPAGRFGFIYRTGRCRRCRQTARSPTGRLTDGWGRPPLHGRKASHAR